jgi:hypothetical protein
LKKQKISSWIYFTAILGVVLFILNVVWINNETGFGKAFVDAVSSLSDSHEVLSLPIFTSPNLLLFTISFFISYFSKEMFIFHVQFIFSMLLYCQCEVHNHSYSQRETFGFCFHSICLVLR